jgi:saccharopine dehydrogenase-like NADP-dependent oxidoreductase
MRILLVGAGGVGSAAAAIVVRRDFYETIVVADRVHSTARGARSTAPTIASRR